MQKPTTANIFVRINDYNNSNKTLWDVLILEVLKFIKENSNQLLLVEKQQYLSTSVKENSFRPSQLLMRIQPPKIHDF
ncbi:unnamed protein product [Paramecium octaurelia]|uniref:Uncharacterized protein n=1 Tax=Paramecium octaurelia TaxID=43137 RepID=A0A8S1U529_PAROT|nr:unnamed protein product [Paramecium octaurelia]